MRQVEDVFAAFGPAVIAEIRRQMRRSGTLGPLLRQLGCRIPRSVDEQYDALNEFLCQYGVIVFLNTVSAADPTSTAYKKHMSATGTRPRIPPAPGVRPDEGYSKQPPNESKVQPAAAPPKGPTPAPAPAGPLVEAETYTGPDRRTGQERRVNVTDRRSKLDTVYKNRRFGGWDRRKTKRREADRLKAQEKKPKP